MFKFLKICRKNNEAHELKNCLYGQPCECSVLISQDFSFYKKIMLYAAYGFRTICQTA